MTNNFSLEKNTTDALIVFLQNNKDYVSLPAPKRNFDGINNLIEIRKFYGNRSRWPILAQLKRSFTILNTGQKLIKKEQLLFHPGKYFLRPLGVK